jgi:hypothetical protein
MSSTLYITPAFISRNYKNIISYETSDDIQFRISESFMSVIGIDYKVSEDELRSLRIKIQWNNEDDIFDSFTLYYNYNSDDDWIYKIETDQGDGNDILIHQNQNQNKEKFSNDSWLTSKKENLGDFRKFSDTVYEISQLRRHKDLNKIPLPYKFYFYDAIATSEDRGFNNENKVENIPFLLSETIIKEPITLQYIAPNKLYFALNGIRYNAENKLISTVLTEDSLISILVGFQRDPLTNLDITKITPVKFLLQNPTSKSRGLKRSRSLEGGKKKKRKNK